jgi:glutaconate CoA-transferase subunit A
MSKVVTAQEAISTHVKPGDMIAVGGFVTNRRPYGLIREVIKQKIGNLYVESGPAGGEIDMLIGAGLVTAINVSYMANSGFSMVLRRFRNAIEKEKSLLFEDYSLDVQTIAYHGAALGLPYMPVKNMLGSDLEREWGISEEERKKHPKLPPKKFVYGEDPFDPGSKLCLVPTPKIDVAFIHAQVASPDGTCRILGPQFQDMDIAMAAQHTIVQCDTLVSDDEIRLHPELNTLTGLVVDAVVPLPFGAHPTQCFGVHDMDPRFFIEYEKISRTNEDFAEFLDKYVYSCADHDEYLDKWGAAALLKLRVQEGFGYVPGLKRK